MPADPSPEEANWLFHSDLQRNKNSNLEIFAGLYSLFNSQNVRIVTGLREISQSPDLEIHPDGIRGYGIFC